LALAGGGLLYSMLKGNQKPEFQPQVTQAAQNLNSQGQELQGYLTTGTLPPGVQAGLNSAQQSAIATIKSQYASRGMSGSSAEAQDISNLNATVVAQGASIATNLLAQGVSEEDMSAQLYQSLMQTSMQQDAQLSSSVANFSGALAGSAFKNL
jgi:hypothetical protein